MAEDIRKEGSFGAGAVNHPGSATCARGQANIALSTQGVADQKFRVSRRWCNRVRSVCARDCLRRRGSDRAECTCEHERGHEHAPNSRCLVCLLTKVVTHLFVLQFSVLSQPFETVEGDKAHNLLERLVVAFLLRFRKRKAKDDWRA